MPYAAKLEAFSAELQSQLAALQAAALASPAQEPKQDSKKQRAIPKQLKAMLPGLSCKLNRYEPVGRKAMNTLMRLLLEASSYISTEMNLLLGWKTPSVFLIMHLEALLTLSSL